MSIHATLQQVGLEWDVEAATEQGFLDEKVLEDIVRLSRAFSYHTMDGEGVELKELFIDDGVVINGIQGISDYGIKEFVRISRQVEERDLRIALTHQSFVARPLGADCCCVVGDFRLFMSVGASAASSVVRATRINYHWRIINGLPRILCLEISFPIDSASIFDFQPSSVSTPGVHAPAVESIEDELGNPLVEFRDVQRLSHYVSEDAISYVEARGRKVLVHCEGNTIEVNEGIGVLERKLGTNFVRIHRSCLVNAWWVRSVSSRGVVLVDGEMLPISARRLSKVRAQLKAVRMPQKISLSDLKKLVGEIAPDKNAM